MSHRISLLDGAAFECGGNETVTDAGRRAGFGFSVACRNGVCERCRGRLVRGKVLIQRKNRVIRAGESAAERVLYCVAQPLTDCEIDVPEVTVPGKLPVHELSCQILSVEALNHDISRVVLRLPAGRSVEWYAGQYLELMLPQGPFAFSIATAPAEGRRDLELHIRHSNDNPASLEVMAALQNNLTVPVRLPGGERYIDELPTRPVWFICGSTGFAPVKAMVEHLRDHGFDRDIRLFWGARTSEDLYLSDLPEQWSAEMPNFHWQPVLSEETRTGFATGLVHEIAIDAISNPREPLFYVGGSPPMAWAVFDALIEAGVPEKDIHSDVYDYAPR